LWDGNGQAGYSPRAICIAYRIQILNIEVKQF
jgi:hypothetical protein